MRLHNVQEMAVAHFTAHPHVGADDIGMIVLIVIMCVVILVGMLIDGVGYE
ncbi:MAG: hypothetical protein ACW99G_11385 [Candidatus Thorarchaeota archaeon]|jgi:hypothetical protein